MKHLLCLLAFPLFVPAANAAGDGPGEFSIRAVVPLPPSHLASLRRLVADDPEAAALAETVKTDAEPWLDEQPQPLEVIHYEGLVNTDPKRIATVEKLREMDGVAALIRHWQATGDPRAAETLRRFVSAWAKTYRPTGNDVNENKFYPLLVAYHQIRAAFPPDEKTEIDAWLRRLGELHEREVRQSTHLTNRYTKHVRLVATIGTILNISEWQAAAEAGLKRFVTESLRADGTSLDLERRDTLTYHASALRPAIELAMLAAHEGRDLYTWESENGGSIQKSVHYLVPYALGEKTRKEWLNTKVDLDRRRSAAGIEKYRAGRLYDPRDALRVMEEASYFDPALTRVVRHLTGTTETERFPSWQMLINEAARRENR